MRRYQQWNNNRRSESDLDSAAEALEVPGRKGNRHDALEDVTVTARVATVFYMMDNRVPIPEEGQDGQADARPREKNQAERTRSRASPSWPRWEQQHGGYGSGRGEKSANQHAERHSISSSEPIVTRSASAPTGRTMTPAARRRANSGTLGPTAPTHGVAAGERRSGVGPGRPVDRPSAGPGRPRGMASGSSTAAR